MVTLMAAAAVLTLGATANAQDPCEVPDNGSGTVTLPPAGCEYLSPDEVHEIIDALPDGTDIQLAPIHLDFICRQSPPPPGCDGAWDPDKCTCPEDDSFGPGGEIEVFSSTLKFHITDNGTLGLDRELIIPDVLCEVHTGPRNPGAPVQDFPAKMVRLQGSLPAGDPDFESLVIMAGEENDLPSPGHTTLTRLPSGDFAVDSFFDISYRIEFVGTPTGVLDGASGASMGTLRMQTPEQAQQGVPAATDTGLIVMALLVVAVGLVTYRRRRLALA